VDPEIHAEIERILREETGDGLSHGAGAALAAVGFRPAMMDGMQTDNFKGVAHRVGPPGRRTPRGIGGRPGG